MAAGSAELVGDRLAQNAGLHGGGVRLQRMADQPRVGFAAGTEGDDAGDARSLGGIGELVVLRTVAIEDRGAVRLDP